MIAALPRVEFSADSASGIECAMALAKAGMSGQIPEQFLADPVHGHIVVARTTNWAIGLLAGSPAGAELLLDPQAEQAMLALQEALGINAEAIGGGAGRRVFVELVLPQLLAFGKKFAEEWLARRLAGG